MTLTWRFFDPHRDYETVCGWWEAWGWPAMPLGSLSGCGVVVSVDGVDMCAAWLYRTDSDLALAEWFISNRTAKKGRKEAMSLLIETLCQLAQRMGARCLISTVRNASLIRALRAHGFGGEEGQMTNLVRTF